MGFRTGWLGALCASWLLMSACDNSDKSKGMDPGDSGLGQGDGDSTSDGGGKPDGGGLHDGGCVYCDGGPDGAVVDLPAGSVGGFVFTTDSPPVPLANVRVLGPENRSVTTDANGFFVLENLTPGDGVLRTASSDHTHALRAITVRDDASLYVELFVKSVYKTSFDPTKGGFAKDKDSGATISFPANGLKRADGSAPKGAEVKVSLVAVPEGKAKAGTTKGTKDVAGVTKDGILKGYTPVEVRVEDEDGEFLQIADGKEASVEFPVHTKGADGKDAPDLWTMDEKDGTWKKDGDAPVKSKSSEGKNVFKAKLKHMSWWSADVFVDSAALTCVRGCVTQGEPSMASNGASVHIAARRTPFASVLSTDENGCFFLDLEPNLAFSVTASNEFGASSVSSFTSGPDFKLVASDRNACTDLGTLHLVAPPAGVARCPAGYERCGEACVDIRNDSDHCGTSCANLVDCGDEGAGPDDSICMEGICQCAPGFTPYAYESTYRCIDFKNDPFHCGTPTNYTSCDTYYTLQTCQDGQCAELLCEGGTTACPVYDDDVGGNVVACVDTNRDPLHCGGCGWQYECDQHVGEGEGPNSNMVCVDGQCGCNARTTLCLPYVESSEIDCVDIANDDDNCGGCGTVQGETIPEHACDYLAQECATGECVDKTCAAGLTLCFGECWDIQNDPIHCGTSCGELSECDLSEICSEGECSGYSCGAGLLECDHQCVPDNDMQNCGECGNVCTNNQTCTDASCSCGDMLTCTGFPYYSPFCVDPLDDQHCGDCVTQCGFGEKCTEVEPGAYECQDIVCQGGTLNCSANQCNDTLTDADHCGACDYACVFGTCVAGSCQCPASQKLCTGANNAICVDIAEPCTNVVLEGQ